ncbi:MAG: hypothetical protein OXT06_08645 [Rhodospirillaceae bacterium]|nr:hypothetical protein [Rhodospirillaceae bacterium]MDD9913427.1 hypothetical protein [Rhodospirillaceae bacterium]MDD9925897.1 hypothetical protein [Rhodospirillaceae bacterium]
MRKQVLSLIAAIGAIAALPAASQAAPQILGLIATATPLPLQCADGVCSVEVSGICLQENRPAPETGTAYKAVPGAAITLASRHDKGQSVAVADQVEIVSLRSFSAVSVRMPEPLVRDLVGDPADATLSIGQLVSALPVAVQGDPDPLTDAEIKMVTGPLRPVAARAAKSNTVNRHTTQTLIGMVNRLPADRTTTATQMTAMRDLADATLGQSPETAQRIAYALDRCAVKVRYQMYPHLRACLGNQHDLYNAVTTQSVWKALQPGS